MFVGVKLHKILKFIVRGEEYERAQWHCRNSSSSFVLILKSRIREHNGLMKRKASRWHNYPAFKS